MRKVFLRKDCERISKYFLYSFFRAHLHSLAMNEDKVERKQREDGKMSEIDRFLSHVLSFFILSLCRANVFLCILSFS